MIRGINRADIFHDEQDRQKFLERLGANVLETKCSLYAWTLMEESVAPAMLVLLTIENYHSCS
jgi:hypothetical protein